MALIEMGHSQPPTQAVTDSATGDRFINENIYQKCLWDIGMQFYLVRDIARQGQFLVCWMDGEHNMEDCFTNHYPTNHHWAQRSTYILPMMDVSNYACYILPNDLWWWVESLPAQENGRRMEKVSPLHGK